MSARTVSPAVVSMLGAQLGNQLFQYAAGRALASARGSELLLHLPKGLDSSLFSGFSLNARRWDDDDRDAHPFHAVLLRSSLLGRAARYAERLRPIERRRWYENDGFNHDRRFSLLGGDIVLSGYWQSYKYFHHLRDHLRKELRFVGPLSAAAQSVAGMIDAHEEAVGIHVRRGAYVQEGWPLLSNDYFEKALRMLVCTQGLSSPRLFVFSNDPAWCAAEMLPGRSTIIVSEMGTTACEDLALMSRCRYLLISPSTFSWWAAYLSESVRAVLAPYRWFFHNYEGFLHEDIYLPEWLIVRD